jgi:CHAD domain-containing protein
MPRRLASTHHWEPGESVEANAARVLPRMAHEYFAAGRKIVASKPDPAALHPFRLKTKQIRYTLEGFRGVYGDSVAALLEKLKPLQNALGDVNDSVATRAEFDLGETFDAFLRQRARSKAKEFCKAWKKGFDVSGEEARWVSILSKVEAAIDSHHLAGDEVRSSQEK